MCSLLAHSFSSRLFGSIHSCHAYICSLLFSMENSKFIIGHRTTALNVCVCVCFVCVFKLLGHRLIVYGITVEEINMMTIGSFSLFIDFFELCANKAFQSKMRSFINSNKMSSFSTIVYCFGYVHLKFGNHLIL